MRHNKELLLRGRHLSSGATCLATRAPGSASCSGSRNPESLECARAVRNLLEQAKCSTLYYMKTAAVTIRLDPSLEEMLDRVCRETGRSRSEVVREALRRQLTLELFEEARRQLIPFAEAQGIYTDEDVFKLVS